MGGGIVSTAARMCACGHARAQWHAPHIPGVVSEPPSPSHPTCKHGRPPPHPTPPHPTPPHPPAPKRIDGDGAIRLVRAAEAAGGVRLFIMVTSLGTGKLGFPAAALNLFWGVLLFKRQAEEALEKSRCVVGRGRGGGGAEGY